MKRARLEPVQPSMCHKVAEPPAPFLEIPEFVIACRRGRQQACMARQSFAECDLPEIVKPVYIKKFLIRIPELLQEPADAPAGFACQDDVPDARFSKERRQVIVFNPPVESPGDKCIHLRDRPDRLHAGFGDGGDRVVVKMYLPEFTDIFKTVFEPFKRRNSVTYRFRINPMDHGNADGRQDVFQVVFPAQEAVLVDLPNRDSIPAMEKQAHPSRRKEPGPVSPATENG